MQSTSKPKWRDWVPDELKLVSGADRERLSDAIAERLIEGMQGDAIRINEVIKQINSFFPNARNIIIQSLVGIQIEQFDNEQLALIRDSLRKICQRHRKFQETKWALEELILIQLDAVADKFTPTDPIANNKWLFSSNLSLDDTDDWREARRKKFELRSKAISEIFDDQAELGIIKFAGSVSLPHEVGLVLGQLDLISDELSFLEQTLLSESQAIQRLALSFVHGCMVRHDATWIIENIIDCGDKFGTSHIAKICQCLPHLAETWEYVESLDNAVEQAYWEAMPRHFYFGAEEAYETAVIKLVTFGRPQVALQVLYAAIRKGCIPTHDLLLTTLKLSMHVTPPNNDDVRDLSSDVFRNVLIHIGNRDDFKLQEKIQLQWLCLPILRDDLDAVSDLTDALSNDPELFAYVVSLVYRSPDEKPQKDKPTVQEQNQARTGHELLRTLRTIPGTNQAGAIDEAQLRNWINDVRTLLDEKGLRKVGDAHIGEILFHSPEVKGDWPCQAVATIIDELGSDDLERGFLTESTNSRGVVTKSLNEGGVQEQQIADKYRYFAEKLMITTPRTAQLIYRLADEYAYEAGLEDDRAELSEDLGW